MIKRNWRFIAAVVTFLIGAGAIWVALRPAHPIIPTSQYQKADYSTYSPGSPRCYPSRLAGLPADQAMDERYRCEQAAEEHRLRSDDLVQQTRSADAAIGMLGQVYRQSLMMLAGTIFGLLTLIAAFAAVLYAKRAADAAEKGLEHSKGVSEAELRPWLKISLAKDWISNSDKSIMFSFIVTLENLGKSPAQNVKVGSKGTGAPLIHSDDFPRSLTHDISADRMTDWSAILPGDHAVGQELLLMEWKDGSGPTNADGQTPARGISPYVVVIAEYTLPSGQAGRTAATFWIGTASKDSEHHMGPIWNHSADIKTLRVRRGTESQVI